MTFFWCEIGSGFEELGSTPPPFPRSTPPPLPYGIKACGYYFSSLRRRHNLTLVSNVCEAAPTSLSEPPTDSMKYWKYMF